MRCIIEGDFEIGAKKNRPPAHRLGELSVHTNTPAATRTSPDPFNILLADGHMRAMDRRSSLASEIMRVQRRICFPARRSSATPGLGTHDCQEFRNYHEFMQRKLYASHFGFDIALIPFITTDDNRMRGMMNLLGPAPTSSSRSSLLRARPALSPAPGPTETEIAGRPTEV